MELAASRTRSGRASLAQDDEDSDVNIHAYGSMMEQIGAARQRMLDQASASGTAGASAFDATLQTQQGGTTGSANSAGPDTTAAAASGATTVSGTGQTVAQGVNQAGSHHHHHHHGGDTGGMFGGDALSALLGGQESTAAGTAPGTTEAGQPGLFASVEGAVTKAISSYFGTQASATAATTTAANTLTV
jgi:hypothetical protein